VERIVSPLSDPGNDGMVIPSGDGVHYNTFPIFAAYIGDYPEQILVTCSITGDCPVCTIPRNLVGEDTIRHPERNLMGILEVLNKFDSDINAFIEGCAEFRIKPTASPFWLTLPYSNVFRSITPDILHQLYQGVFKHLVKWSTEAYGEAEIDARCRRLPPNHNIRIFTKGLSALSRVTGQEHDQISRFFLTLIADAPLPDNVSSIRLVRAVKALIDFLHLAQYPIHSTTTLKKLDMACQRFHNNNNIFLDLGIRSNFTIPKLHFLNHYVDDIKCFGTLDNFNTENTERLHIDMAKDAYRASNHKDEYPQMTRWLQRKEKIMRHSDYIDWRLRGSYPPLRAHWIPPGLNVARTLKMAKHPSERKVAFPSLATRFGATFFRIALSRFIVSLTLPHLRGIAFENTSEYLNLNCDTVSVYHRIKFLHRDLLSGSTSTADSIHVQSARKGKRRAAMIPGRFDTALTCIREDNKVLDVRKGVLCYSSC